jgi:hypothetical protein
MKNIFTLIILGSSLSLIAQNPPPDEDALENVIVEKYYVAGPEDVQSGLPLGATTYRVFLDLKPGYELQQINASIPHPVTIGSSAGFYNSEFGATFGSDFLPLLLNFGTAALDSYVTIKAGTQSSSAIVKTLDTDGSLLTGAEGFLQNVDEEAGISVLEADGLIPNVGNLQLVSQLGLGDQLIQMFGTTNSASTEFYSDNGAWFNLDGIVADTEENLICIGQFTTLSCAFNFKLNIQIIIPEELLTDPISYSVIRFVAETHPEDSVLNASNDNFYIYQKDFLDFSVGDDECLVSTRNAEHLQNDWKVLPNPASDVLNISLSKDFQDLSYAIYDLSGKLVANAGLGNQSTSTMIEVNTQDLENGVYLIQLRTANLVSTKKFVVLH